MRSISFTLFFVLVGAFAGYQFGLHTGLERATTLAHESSNVAADAGRSESAGTNRSSAEHTATELVGGGSQDPVSLGEGTPGESQALLALISKQAWYQVQRVLRQRPDWLDQTHGDLLHKTIAQHMNKFDAPAMRSVLSAYLQLRAGDFTARLLMADLQQLSGMREAALHTYLDILAIDDASESAQLAREGADTLLRILDRELRSANALQAREVLWRGASERYGRSDYFRLQWAKAYAADSKWDAARRLLAETGTWDVSQAQIDEVLAHIELAAQGLSFRRDGERMLADASTPAGLALTLLVDTGANITSLNRTALRALGAQRQNDKVRVQTANGIVTANVFVVPELEVQGRRYANLRVLELPVDITGLDGLLGLDVIREVNEFDF